MTRVTHRSGLTLTEVLVTLAILAFGILGILTLFPLAASQMAIAVREDRSAQCANAADAYMRTYWKTEIVEKMTPPGPTEPFYTAFDNPGGVLPATGGVTEWSYPVVIDPMGVATRGATQLGDSANTNLPRRSLGLLGTDKTYALRVCSQMDGMSYDDNGRPAAPGGTGTAERELRYNWMWVLQCGPGSRTSASMAVVVYDFRPHLFPVSETVVTGRARVGSTQIALDSPVPAKPGNWILDATDPATGGGKMRNSTFYQIVSMDPTGLQVELSKPIDTPHDSSTTYPAGTAYNAKFVVLKGVSGVYVRPQLP